MKVPVKTKYQGVMAFKRHFQQSIVLSSVWYGNCRSYGSLVYNYLICNQCLSPLALWVQIQLTEFFISQEEQGIVAYIVWYLNIRLPFHFKMRLLNVHFTIMKIPVKTKYQVVIIQLRRGVLDTTLCDKVCQWLTTCRLFSLDTPFSSTNKTDCHDITEILLKVALIHKPLLDGHLPIKVNGMINYVLSC
jgi:hypothetical protein